MGAGQAPGQLPEHADWGQSTPPGRPHLKREHAEAVRLREVLLAPRRRVRAGARHIDRRGLRLTSPVAKVSGHPAEPRLEQAELGVTAACYLRIPPVHQRRAGDVGHHLSAQALLRGSRPRPAAPVVPGPLLIVGVLRCRRSCARHSCGGEGQDMCTQAPFSQGFRHTAGLCAALHKAALLYLAWGHSKCRARCLQPCFMPASVLSCR